MNDKSPELTDIIITKYNSASLICGKIYNELKSSILNGNYDIKYLCNFGNTRIQEELSKIYKKEEKNIAFPVSISLNNTVSNSSSEYDSTIKLDDIIKIELGVSISGYISVLAETFTISLNQQVDDINKFLIDIQNNILVKIKQDETGDEIRMYIESQCTNNNVFPIENCISFQQEENFLTTFDSKYMILNYKKYYNKNDELISKFNDNYIFEENDVYTINLSVTPNNKNDSILNYKKHNKSYIYRLNEFNYSLKLKNSRLFYNIIEKNHSKYAFNIEKYDNIQSRIGIKEMLKNDIIEEYPILYTTVPVIVKKFTILVRKDYSKLLKYNLI